MDVVTKHYKLWKDWGLINEKLKKIFSIQLVWNMSNWREGIGMDWSCCLGRHIVRERDWRC